MSELSFMMTIISRGSMPKYLALYREHGLDVLLVTLGKGTASSETLHYLGLESSEKAVVLGLVTDALWAKVKKDLQNRLRIDVPGEGIAFSVPCSSIGGKRELMFLTANQKYERGDESTLKGTTHELLLVIANQGYSEMVMDAARGAGAAGGTVIHAKGTGMKQAEQFFGVSLASEKEIIFIISKSEMKNGIMQAIMRGAGMESEAKAIVVSLPVTDTAGLRLIESND